MFYFKIVDTVFKMVKIKKKICCQRLREILKYEQTKQNRLKKDVNMYFGTNISLFSLQILIHICVLKDNIN